MAVYNASLLKCIVYSYETAIIYLSRATSPMLFAVHWISHTPVVLEKVTAISIEVHNLRWVGHNIRLEVKKKKQITEVKYSTALNSSI